MKMMGLGKIMDEKWENKKLSGKIMEIENMREVKKWGEKKNQRELDERVEEMGDGTELPQVNAGHEFALEIAERNLNFKMQR